jgi:hypothetical protein
MNEGWFSSWRFRTSHPSFSEGDVLKLSVGRYDPETDQTEARIGDTILRIEDGGPELVDEWVRIRVNEFDDARHRGTAELLEVLDTKKF